MEEIKKKCYTITAQTIRDMVACINKEGITKEDIAYFTRVEDIYILLYYR